MSRKTPDPKFFASLYQLAHCYSWRESAVHGIRSAVAFCGFKADAERGLYKPKKLSDERKCKTCLKIYKGYCKNGRTE